MKKPSSERRRAPRIPVGVYLQQLVEDTSHRCFTSDLSERGLYMEQPVASFVRHSKQIQLEIPLPDDLAEPLWASAEVVYDCFDGLFHGTAVRFTAMGTRDRERLTRWIANNAEASLSGA